MQLIQTVDLEQIRQNIISIRDYANCQIMFMVKANAYGLGILPISKATECVVDAFGVATVDEGVKLRKNNITKPILVTDCLVGEYCQANRYNLTVSVGDVDAIRQVAKTNLNVNLKINTGMNRFGINVDDIDSSLDCLKSSNVNVIGVCSHLYKPNIEQLAQFDSALAKTKAIYPHCIGHICSSSSICYNKYDMVRIGLSAYKDSMSLSTCVVASRFVKSGQHIGYGDNVAKQDCYITWLFGGYADGISREYPPCVQINGRLCKPVAVCMDTFAVITNTKIPQNTSAVIVSPTHPTSVVADEENTIDYTVLTSFRGRVKRIYNDKTRGKSDCQKQSQNYE